MVVRLAESLAAAAAGAQRPPALGRVRAGVPADPPGRPGAGSVRAALEHVLAAHRPYPAIVVDRHGGLVLANEAFGLLTEGAAPGLLGAARPTSTGWRCTRAASRRASSTSPEWARHILDGLQRVLRDPDDRLADLHAELSAYVPPTGLRARPPGLRRAPASAARDAGDLRLMTTITTFATAVDVTVAELKLEAFLPADQATAAILTARSQA